MTKIDHQHRLRGLNWQIPRILVNLCFQQDLIRKPSRGTYSSKEIMEFHHGINVGGSRRFQEALHRSGARPTDMWGQPAPLPGRLAPMGPTYHPLYYVGSPSPPSMYLSHYFKSVWSKGWGLMLCAIYIYICLHPPGQMPHLMLRVKNLETLILMSTRIRLSNQEKISSQ